MTVTVTGFAGTVDEQQIAEILALGGVRTSVTTTSDWEVTAVTGDRKVSVAAGTGYTTFLEIESDAAKVLTLPTPTNGQWFAIVNRACWTDQTIAGQAFLGHTATFLAIPHSTTSTTVPTAPPTTVPATFQSTPGVCFDHLIAWAWVNSANTTVTLFDRRNLPPSDRLEKLEQRGLIRHYGKGVKSQATGGNQTMATLDFGTWPAARRITVRFAGKLGFGTAAIGSGALQLVNSAGSTVVNPTDGDDIVDAPAGKWVDYSTDREIDFPANLPATVVAKSFYVSGNNCYYAGLFSGDVHLAGEYA